ncbi:hypothetical protein SDC9_99611 [bioreactor metagenome]|uniref:Uncharacterized protein n=1 Tax=bioreactor metagenome TaxID=1076179 RepID=A0A645AIK5_9ZZZZ
MRLVAATTITLLVLLKPSSSINSWFNVWSFSLLLSEFLLAPRASISSMNMMLGASFLALSNIILTLFAPTPTYFSTNSEPLEYMNVAFASPAMALAIKVLPVPGGPYKSIPLGTFASMDLYLSSLFKKSMTSIKSSLISSRPATSSNPICIFGSSVFFFSK